MAYTVGTFKDWAGQEVAYRVRPTRKDEESLSSEWMTCEIDPHGRDEWTVAGRGNSVGTTVAKAKVAWDKFDQAV